MFYTYAQPAGQIYFNSTTSRWCFEFIEIWNGFY